jgi:hypothetical protein
MEQAKPQPVKRPPLAALQACARTGCTDCAAVLLRVWLLDTAAQMAVDEGYPNA